MVPTICHREVLSVVMIFVVAGCSTIAAIDSYKILMLPTLENNHVVPLMAVADGLAARGHEVTVLIGMHYPLDYPEIIAGQRPGLFVKWFDDGGYDYEGNIFNTSRTLFSAPDMAGQLDAAFENQHLTTCQHLLVDNDSLFDKLVDEKFNVAIVDSDSQQPVSKCLYLVPHRLGIPVITYANHLNPHLVRVPWLPTITPTNHQYEVHLASFSERLENAANFFAAGIIQRSPDIAPAILDKYRQYGAFSSLDEVAAKSILWLYPRDHILDAVQPTAPHVISVGGLTSGRYTGVLSREMHAFVTGAQVGTVIVNLGPHSAVGLPKEIFDKFVDAFRRLEDFRFIWRFANDEKWDIPPNVLALPWIPQHSLLASLDAVLFITHCGNNGQYEAVNQGVPMIGFPVSDDERHNARRMVANGFGVSMDIQSFTADNLIENVRRILPNNSRASPYKERVTKAAEIMRSAPVQPVDKAVFWIEHVCEYGGEHLLSGGHNLPLYSYWMLDIFGLLAAIVCVMLLVGYLLLKFLLKKLTSRRTRSSSDKKKKN